MLQPKKICLALIFSVFLGSSFGQEKPIEKSLLWKISGKNLTQPSFLYGTIHVICPEELNISGVAVKAFEQSEQLYLELDMDEPSLSSQMQQLMLNSTHLRNLMKEKDYRKISTFFKKKMGYSIDVLGMIKPFYLLSFTYSPMIGCNQPISVESVLTKMAQQRKIEIGGLETLQDQISVFDKISTREQAQMLVDYVQNFDKMQESFHLMLRAYHQQDLSALVHSSETSNLTDKYESLLLDNRNEKWIRIIEEKATEKPTFFAFGAAHLAGNKGVIKLLREKGYTVEALRKESELATYYNLSFPLFGLPVWMK